MRHGQSLLIVGVVLAVVVTCRGADDAGGANRPHATGHLQLKFTERSPLSTPEELAQRTNLHTGGMPPDPKVPQDYDIGSATFDVVVPPRYKSSEPHGLFVWVGVSDFSPKWFDALARHKLICVMPPRNTRGGGLTHLGLSIDAVHNLKTLYNIDEKRVYVSGFSAGAGSASFLLAGYRDVFAGGLFLNSGPFYICVDEPTVMSFLPTWHGKLDEIKRDTAIVLMWGERDNQYKPAECRAQYNGLVLDGFQRAVMFIVPGGGHAPPNPAWFEKGVAALDQTKPKRPPTTAPTTQPRAEPGQIAQARRIFATALMSLKSRDQQAAKYPNAAKRAEETAKGYLKQVIDDYPTTPAAAQAREKLAELERPTTKPANR